MKNLQKKIITLFKIKFIFQVKSYIDVTQDYKFLKKILPSLDREFDYWEQRKIVDVKYKGEYYKMARYYVNHDGPRPESYRYLLLISPLNIFKNELLY